MHGLHASVSAFPRRFSITSEGSLAACPYHRATKCGSEILEIFSVFSATLGRLCCARIGLGIPTARFPVAVLLRLSLIEPFRSVPMTRRLVLCCPGLYISVHCLRIFSATFADRSS